MAFGCGSRLLLTGIDIDEAVSRVGSICDNPSATALSHMQPRVCLCEARITLWVT